MVRFLGQSRILTVATMKSRNSKPVREATDIKLIALVSKIKQLEVKNRALKKQLSRDLPTSTITINGTTYNIESDVADFIILISKERDLLRESDYFRKNGHKNITVN